MKIENRIIVPVAAFEADGHESLRKMFAAYFGGYTMTRSEGGWVSPEGELMEESVFVYDIAMDDSLKARTTFWDVAGFIRRSSGERCIYIRIDGEVHFRTAEDDRLDSEAMK